MGVSKMSNYIQIKIKMPNPSQEPSAFSKAPNEDIKDIDVLCTLKGEQLYPNQYQDENDFLKTMLQLFLSPVGAIFCQTLH